MSTEGLTTNLGDKVQISGKSTKHFFRQKSMENIVKQLIASRAVNLCTDENIVRESTQQSASRADQPTNNSIIVFIEDTMDYDNMLQNVKSEEMSFHTYTRKSDKSHAFVLHGLGDGTKIDDLEEDLMYNYEIQTRTIYRMTTRNRRLIRPSL